MSPNDMITGKVKVFLKKISGENSFIENILLHED